MVQQLLLRGSRDFNSLPGYNQFINPIVAKINRQCKTRFEEEKVHLSALPCRRTNDFSEQFVKVSSGSTINVKIVTYTVPSRLIGSGLLVHNFDVRLVLLYGHELTLTLNHVYAEAPLRTRSINYRHIIHSLAKKPNTFKCSRIRDDIVPVGGMSLLWQQLTAHSVSDSDCKYMVTLLLLAHNYDCEAALGRYVLVNVESGQRATIEQCIKLFGPERIEVPKINTQQHSLRCHENLIGGLNG